MPELKDAINILTEMNEEIKGEGIEIIMPYVRKVPKERNEYLSKGRKLFQKRMGYKIVR
jgi:hypothetical protein